jgi:RNA polymerase sigma factor for flagellar operon FliA
MGQEREATAVRRYMRRPQPQDEFQTRPCSAPALDADQEKILLEQVPYVRYHACRIHDRLPPQIDIDDLISAGMIGLMDAFVRFEESKKIPFGAYAQFRIKGAILDSLRSQDWGPRELRRKGRELEEATRVLTARLGRLPDQAEVAKEMGLCLDEYLKLWGDLRGLDVAPLHAQRYEDSAETEMDCLPGPAQDDPLLQCLEGELKSALTDAIAKLPDRERQVLTLRYYEEFSIREIGLALGVHESRASQIHTSAIKRLRNILEKSDSAGGNYRDYRGLAAHCYETRRWAGAA